MQTINKKYEFILTDSKTVYDYVGEKHVCYRIRALRDVFLDVHEGDLGGYVEMQSDYDIIDIYDSSWVYPDSILFGKSLLCNNSEIRNSKVEDSYLSRADIENSIIIDCTLKGASVINQRELVNKRVDKDYTIIK